LDLLRSFLSFAFYLDINHNIRYQCFPRRCRPWGRTIHTCNGQLANTDGGNYRSASIDAVSAR